MKPIFAFVSRLALSLIRGTAIPAAVSTLLVEAGRIDISVSAICLGNNYPTSTPTQPFDGWLDIFSLACTGSRWMRLPDGSDRLEFPLGVFHEMPAECGGPLECRT